MKWKGPERIWGGQSGATTVIRTGQEAMGMERYSESGMGGTVD